MKKLFSIIMTAAVIFSVFTFTANAADNEWTVYAAAVDYKETYAEDDPLPKEPGLKYTDLGLQFFSAEEEMLKQMSANAWGTLQTKEKVSYKNGLTMTVIVEKFNDSPADKWISFSIWDSQKISQGSAGYGCGWFCLVRPTQSGCKLESWICSPTVAMNLCTQANIDTNIYNGEALEFEIKPGENGKYTVYVNGVDLKAGGFTQYMENDEAYIGLTAHQGVREQFMFTVTEFNGEKPTGTENIEPYIPENLVPIPSYEDTPPTPEGQPCWTWSSERVKNNVPGIGMKSIANDDGSLHITFDENSPQINATVKTGSYSAQEFPIWAILFNSLDDTGVNGQLWYCAGEVYSAQEGSAVGINWTNCDYDPDNDTGWRLMTVDLEFEDTWEGYINNFLLALSGAGALDGEEADIMWIGFFRTERDAYNYAGMGDYYTRLYGAETTEETVTEAGTAAETKDEQTDDNVNDTAEQTAAKTDKVTEKVNTNTQGGANTKVIIGIIAGVVAVAAVVAVIVIKTKKKK